MLVFTRTIQNQIPDITVVVESGVSSILINAGNIQNKGIEIAIDANLRKYSKNFPGLPRLTIQETAT
jgi:iron complex outermembrane receptor protein